MTNRPRYRFQASRYSCGCAYHTPLDTALRCPRHQGWLLSTETFHSDTRDPPDIPGLVKNPHFPDRAMTLHNDERNSIYSTVVVKDSSGSEISDHDPDHFGICHACYVETGETVETRIAACECSDILCDHRWCGDTSGLHAFWRLHAQGRSEEVTGIPKRDIFSIGLSSTLPEYLAVILDRERAAMADTAERLLDGIVRYRESAEYQGVPDGVSPYSSDYLTKYYEECNSADTNSRRQERSRNRLITALTRFHLMGAIQPPPSVPKGQAHLGI